ncbi:MAG TPA: V-type ATP synthase subunit I [Firmicutes bacterium]|nr:V-type ATP synthase subunit I [Bacillota bacterium]
MKKVTVVGHNSVREKVVETLQDLSAVQLVDLRSNLSDEDASKYALAGVDDPDLEAKSYKVNYCLKYLDSAYGKPAKGFIESFTGAKIHVPLSEYREILEGFDLEGVYRHISEMEARLSDIRNQAARLESQLELVSPWVQMDIPVELLPYATHGVEVVPFTAHVSKFEKLKLACEEHAVALEKVAEEGKTVFFLAAYFKDDEDAADGMRSAEINRVSFGDLKGKPSDIVESCQRQLSELREEEKRIEEEGRSVLQHRRSLLVLSDHYAAALARKQAQGRFLGTREAFALGGWIKASQVDQLKSRLAEISTDIEVLAEDPQPGDRVPIILENSKWLEPFEVVTNIYGFPGYDEVDPTPLLAPFFTIYFGLALSDAGYGIMLLLASIYFLKKVEMAPSGKKLFRLLAYGAVSTIVFGAMMGGWFGNLFDVLAVPGLREFKQRFFVLDPMNDPLKLLVICLALGVIQIWFGILLKMLSGIKAGAVKDAVLDQGGWLVLIASVALFAVTSAVGTVIGTTIAKYLVILGAIWVVVASSRAQKNILLKPFTGLYGLYGGVGYLSDTLSYMRLLALGLATGVIGNVINQIALLGKGIPILGWIFAVVVLAGGHVFNLLINVLGSFIHSGRLQFVEFFTKFFEGQGKGFQPFKVDNKYITVEEE